MSARKMVDEKGREIKAIEIQVRFDGTDKGYKHAYELADGMRKQYPYVRLIRSVDGMATKDVRQLKIAYYVENYKEKLRNYENVVDAWFEGKKIVNLKKQ